MSARVRVLASANLKLKNLFNNDSAHKNNVHMAFAGNRATDPLCLSYKPL